MKKNTKTKQKYYQIAGRSKPDAPFCLFKKHFINYQEALSAMKFIKSYHKESELELWKVEQKTTIYKI